MKRGSNLPPDVSKPGVVRVVGLVRPADLQSHGEALADFVQYLTAQKRKAVRA